MFIIEGADCVGKTTLSMALVDYLNQKYDEEEYFLYAHMGNPNKKFRKFQTAECLMNFANSRMIYDRHWLSSYIYDMVRGEFQTTFAFSKELCQRLNAMNIRTVILTAPESVIKRRYNAERELFPLEKVLKANELYNDAFYDFPDLIRVRCTSEKNKYVVDYHDACKHVYSLQDLFNTLIDFT